MARVTVEDCIEKIPNRFELVLMAAQRARNISRGEQIAVDRDNDKNPVVALREIAEEKADLPSLEADLIRSLQRAPEPEPAEEEVIDLIAKKPCRTPAPKTWRPMIWKPPSLPSLAANDRNADGAKQQHPLPPGFPPRA